jgi:16S rRNA (uracil1498-N3)-methyltransferase
LRLSRVYVDTPLAGRESCELGGAAANHVARVLRLRVGDHLVLFDGRGGEYSATVARAGRDRVTVSIGAHFPAERESGVRIALVQGISRGERMDFVVQKATELGVTRIVPIAAARSVVRAGEAQAARKLEHWRSILIGACEQCGRNRLPALDPPTSWTDWLAKRTAEGDALILSARAPVPLREALAQHASYELAVGPEGGWTPDEEAAALAAGYRAVRLGPRILRTETAALAALATIQSQVGDL